jgi:hypothetical protein
MADPIEEMLAPAVMERAMSVFEILRERNHYEIVKACKALTPHVFELIGTGQKDEQRLVVSALTYLKSLPGAAQRAEATHFTSTFTDCKSCGDVGLSST